MRSRGNASFYFQSSVQSNPPVYIPGMGIGCKTHRMPWYKWQCFIFTKQKKSTGTKNKSHKLSTDQSSWRHASEEKLKGRSPSDGSAGGNFFPSVTSLFFPYYKEREGWLLRLVGEFVSVFLAAVAKLPLLIKTCNENRKQK